MKPDNKKKRQTKVAGKKIQGQNSVITKKSNKDQTIQTATIPNYKNKKNVTEKIVGPIIAFNEDQAQILIDYMLAKNLPYKEFVRGEIYEFKKGENLIIKFRVEKPFILAIHDSNQHQGYRKVELLGKFKGEGVEGIVYECLDVAKLNTENKIYEIKPSSKVAKFSKSMASEDVNESAKLRIHNWQVEQLKKEREGFSKFVESTDSKPQESSLLRVNTPPKTKGSVVSFTNMETLPQANKTVLPGVLFIKKLAGVSASKLPEETSAIERLIFAYSLVDKLERLHNEHNVVNHDIKGDNVLFDPVEVESHFLDAGVLAKENEAVSLRGTPHYMSPNKLAAYFQSIYLHKDPVKKYSKKEDYYALASVIAELFIDKRIIEQASNKKESPIPNKLLKYVLSLDKAPGRIRDLSIKREAIKKEIDEITHSSSKDAEVGFLTLLSRYKKLSAELGKEILPLLKRKGNELASNNDGGYDFSAMFSGSLAQEYSKDEKVVIESLVSNLSQLKATRRPESLKEIKDNLATLINNKIKKENLWENLSAFMEKAEKEVGAYLDNRKKKGDMEHDKKHMLFTKLQAALIQAKAYKVAASKEENPRLNWKNYREAYRLVRTHFDAACQDENIKNLNDFRGLLKIIVKPLNWIASAFSEKAAKFGLFQTASAKAMLSVNQHFQSFKSVNSSFSNDALASESKFSPK